MGSNGGRKGVQLAEKGLESWRKDVGLIFRKFNQLAET